MLLLKVEKQAILKEAAKSDLNEVENKKEKLSKTLSQELNEISLDNNEIKNIITPSNNSKPTLPQKPVEIYSPPILKTPQVN